MPALQFGQKNVMHKQIPTLLGLVVLVVALGVGLFFFGGGPGVFAPRATPQTTPKNVKITNVTDSQFTVSFLTDEKTIGFVKYGTAPDALNQQSGDDRDQLSGSVASYTLHHITVRNLQPGSSYFFTIGTDAKTPFDNQGVPFSTKTFTALAATSTAKTIYGNVVDDTGAPAEGSIVYASSAGMGELSTLIKNSGSWAIPLATARTTDGAAFFTVADATAIQILVQGQLATLQSQVSTTVATAQPVATIALGTDNLVPLAETAIDDSLANPGDVLPIEQPLDDTQDLTTDSPFNSSLSQLVTPEKTATNSGVELNETTETTGSLSALTSTKSATLSSVGGSDTLATTTPENKTIDLTDTADQVVTTSQPVITGVAAPAVLVTIEVHSDNQISQEVVTDDEGNFVFDMTELETQLEPGEHTVTYSYIDPNTGETVTETKTFVVEEPQSASSTLLAQADTSNVETTTPLAQANTNTGPYGSGNPYPIPSPTATPKTSTGSAAATGSATTSGRTTSKPSTQSGIPVSGSTGTTIALLLGGVFFVLAGVWSYWVAYQLKEAPHAEP